MMSILERVRAETREAMKAGERDRVAALRLVASELQKDAKLGEGDEIAVLQRERKRRLEAAQAYREAGSEARAAAEEAEATLIEAYLPAQLSDQELSDLAMAAIEEAGASGPHEMGKVMSVLMPRVEGRADGKRVREVVRARLAGGA